MRSHSFFKRRSRTWQSSRRARLRRSRSSADPRRLIAEALENRLLLAVTATELGDMEFVLYSTTCVSGGFEIPNTFIGVDPRTGSQTAIGVTGQTNEQWSLDSDPISGSLFGVCGVERPGVITRIAPDTGTTSIAATLPDVIHAITVSPIGQVFGIAGLRTLGRIDIENGTFSPIGDVLGGTLVESLDFSPQGTLYAVLYYQEPFEQHLITVDPTNAAVVSRQFIVDKHNIGDIDYAPDGYLYATNYGPTLLRIEPTTASTTVIGYGQLGALGGIASLSASPVVPPSVVSISSIAADGIYNAGHVITVAVTFTKPVIVTGVPHLAMATGDVADYVGGSGTKVLSFDYTVANGQNSPDLDYLSNSALALNGGTIRDDTGTDADLILPDPGTEGSLGANKNFLIDTTAPEVLLSSTPDVIAGGGHAYSLSVTYVDTTEVEVSTLDNADIRVTGPNGFNESAALVSVDTASDGSPRTAMYQITAPGGAWSLADNGTYTVWIEPNQVTDTAGNPVLAGLLGTFTVSVPDSGLGTVDFLQLDGLSLANGNLNYQLRTAHPGFLTLEVLAPLPPKSAGIRLYDRDPLANPGLAPLTTSALVGVNQRAELLVESGQTYFLELYGTNTDFSLRIANLVQHDGTTVNVFGTAGDDQFIFGAANSRFVGINGVEYDFPDSQVSLVQFDGGEGLDRVELRDSPGDETLEAWARQAVFTNGPGDPVADFTVNVSGFEELQSYASSGGDDSAVFHGSEGNDKFKAEPADSYAKIYGGAMYNRVKFFDRVDAYGGGKDLARVFDTAGNETFEGTMGLSRLAGSGFEIAMHDFWQVIAYAAAGGTDTATLTDSARKDQFFGKAHKSEMLDVATDGDVYRITARAFDVVHARATDTTSGTGGTDVAKLWGTALDDYVEAAQDWLRYGVRRPELDPLYELLAFESVMIRETPGGNDKADVNDNLAYQLAFDDGWETI